MGLLQHCPGEGHWDKQAADTHPWSHFSSSSPECQPPSTPCPVQRSSHTPNYPIPSTHEQPHAPCMPLPGAAEGLSPCSWELLAPQPTPAHAVHKPGREAQPHCCNCDGTQLLQVTCDGTQVFIILFPTTTRSSLPGVCIKLPQPGAQTYDVSNPSLGEDIKCPNSATEQTPVRIYKS